MSLILKPLILLVCVLSTHASNDTENELQELKKEKDELVVKIQDAIEDSAKTLQKNNDTDSITGLHHLKELQRQFNETVIEDELSDIMVNTSARRNQQPRYLKKGKLKLDLFDIAGLFSKKEKVSKTKKERNRTQVVMREKLREWMYQKELERKKILQYRQRVRYVSERCPKFGTKKNKKKKKKRKSRRAAGDSKEKNKNGTNKDCFDKDDGKNKNKKSSRKASHKYPCCRKCCKSSYLGCL